MSVALFRWLRRCEHVGAIRIKNNQQVQNIKNDIKKHGGGIGTCNMLCYNVFPHTQNKMSIGDLDYWPYIGCSENETTNFKFLS